MASASGSRLIGNHAVERFRAVARKRFDQFSKSPEQISRVMRAWRSFRMILHREKWHPYAAQSLDGVVVEIYVRQLGAAAHRISIDGESVILRSDFDSAGPQILDWMIRTMMAEVQFVGFTAKREAENLMAEADTENRFLTEDAADGLVRVRQRGGIAGTIGQKNSVRIVREN